MADFDYVQLLGDIAQAVRKRVLWVRTAGPHSFWTWAGYAECAICGEEHFREDGVMGASVEETTKHTTVIYVCADRVACRNRASLDPVHVKSGGDLHGVALKSHLAKQEKKDTAAKDKREYRARKAEAMEPVVDPDTVPVSKDSLREAASERVRLQGELMSARNDLAAKQKAEDDAEEDEADDGPRHPDKD